MSNLLIHIADRVLNRPLLIMPDKLALIASVLEGRIGIDATELREIEATEDLRNGPNASRFNGSARRQDGSSAPYLINNGVAVIPVLGSLVNRGAWLGSKSGMTSYEGIGFQIDQAAADKDVKSILLDIDSPGGEAVGCFEVADKVRSAAKVKPVTAIVNGMAASAAYAIASAASQIISTPSGVSGSIGVVLMHADYSNHLHQKGIKPTFIHAGAHKVDGNPYEPLTDAVKGDLQAEVNQFYDLFVSGVAKGRKGRMTDKAIRGTEARTFIGQAAVDAGLVDAIGSFETVLADLSKRGTVRSTSTRTSMDDKTYTKAELDAAVATARTDTMTSMRTETETALTAASNKARTEGATAERERISGIVGCDEAKGKSVAALHIATTTDMSVDAAKGMLKIAGKDDAAASAAGHGLYLTEQPAAGSKSDAKGNHGWDDITASVNKQFAGRK